MNKLHRLGWGASLGLLLALGCSDDEGSRTDSPAPVGGTSSGTGGEVVNAGEPDNIPGSVVAARYWVEADPKTGKAEAFLIHPGNVIYRSEAVALTQSELRYNFSGTGTRDTTCSPGATCVPPANTIRLSTPATTVSFMDSMGNCISNGMPCGTPGNHAPFPSGDNITCAQPNTFCFNGQAVSSYSQPLPNLVLRFANPGASPGSCGPSPASPIIGCQPNSMTTALGLCRFSSPISTEIVDNAESNLASCIPGGTAGGTTTYACNYCMGNGGRVTPALTGLRYALIPNQGAAPANDTVRNINTITAAFKLTGSDTFTVVTEIRYSTPGIANSTQVELVDFDEDNNCALPTVSSVFVNGGGFGIPSGCRVWPPVNCPVSEAMGPPAAGHIVQAVTGGGSVTVPDDHFISWSDRQIGFVLPDGVDGTGVRVSVTTPLGGTITTATFDVCGGGSNRWESLTGDGITAIQPAAGVLGGNIVVAGGRNDAADLTTALSTVNYFAVPAATAITVSAGPPLPAVRWGAGYVVANGRLWVIGGSNGTSCQRTTYSLGSVADPMWQTEATLPLTGAGSGSRCAPIVSVVGNFIYVTGGTITQAGTTIRAGTCRLDATNPVAWTCEATDAVTDRFGGIGSSDGTTAWIIGGGTAGGASSAVDELTDAGGGAAAFVAGDAALPLARFLPGAALANGRTYVFGGQASTALGAAGETTLYYSTHGTSQSWMEAGAGGTILSRSGHALVSATCGGCMAAQLYAVGGQHNGAAVSTVQKYTE